MPKCANQGGSSSPLLVHLLYLGYLGSLFIPFYHYVCSFVSLDPLGYTSIGIRAEATFLAKLPLPKHKTHKQPKHVPTKFPAVSNQRNSTVTPCHPSTTVPPFSCSTPIPAVQHGQTVPTSTTVPTPPRPKTPLSNPKPLCPLASHPSKWPNKS